MQKYLVFIFIAVAVLTVKKINAQSDFMRPGDFGTYLIERNEVKQGRLDSIYFTDIQPFERGQMGKYIAKTDADSLWTGKVDRFNRQYLIRDNLPFTGDFTDEYQTDKPVLKAFFHNRANFYTVEEGALNLYVNPVLNLEGGQETGFDDGLTYVNTRGAEVRGNIDGKIGFYSVVTENQVVAPHFVRHRRGFTNGFFPGEGFGKGLREGRGLDFFNVRGYFTFRPVKHVQVMFGKDRNALGNGIRSLLLDNNHESYTQMRINTKIWKFHYQNIFAEMIWPDPMRSGYTNLPYAKKYVSMHYLSVDVLKNLRVSFFEGVVFHDNNNTGRGFEFGYLNPVIFYRAIEHNLGDNDNMMIGGNVYYIPVKKLSLYGQFVFSEFKVGELRARNGWFGNQYGLQGGFKYVDAFGISNLDIHGEYNRVRPYVYGHTNPGASFNHFGQPLAHTLGANFREYIGKVKLQPFPRLNISASIVYFEQGRDPDNNTNWGADIRKNPSDPEQTYGNTVAQGEFTKVALTRFNVSYQATHNLFLDANVQNRVAGSSLESHRYNALWVTGGLRWNIARRNYKF